ncbi:DUF190 domain-containing protein [Ignicoccus hospitalis]|uniref:Uncharacterized protein n=1 Tax=Ignicoccus hospitalis (strain KIN4/I / DSM 18386 / JCM 14125) TaxID=453591 RepID=A8ABU1_IGNH4|nr:DUF190 domain-containing protein [Ignicoccus hospitalis]ABU82393.1 protein of unknown function DUF190 [Ignicoccus hospitalis KIN4/I]HIH90868.1 DUF190 domain-containing protein [Desulfurococcaceae archaeon]
MKAFAVFLSEGDVYEDVPLHKVIMEKAKEMGISGMTIIKGYTGYGKHKGTSEIDPFHGYGDKPVIVVVIEEEEKGKKFVELVKSLKSDALVVSWNVERL